MLLCNVKSPVTKKLVVTSHSLVSFALVQVLRSIKGTFLINSNKGSWRVTTLLQIERGKENRKVNTELSLFLWACHLCTEVVKGLHFGSENVFSENSWLKNPLSLEAEKCLPSQFIAYCVFPRFTWSQQAALLSYRAHIRPVFVFTITLREPWGKNCQLCAQFMNLTKTNSQNNYQVVGGRG